MSDFEIFAADGLPLVHLWRAGRNLALNIRHREAISAAASAGDGVTIAPEDARRLAEKLRQIADEAEAQR